MNAYIIIKIKEYLPEWTRPTHSQVEHKRRQRRRSPGIWTPPELNKTRKMLVRKIEININYIFKIGYKTNLLLPVVVRPSYTRKAWNLNGGEESSSSYCPYLLWPYSVTKK